MNEFEKLATMEQVSSTRDLCHLIDELTATGPATTQLLMDALQHRNAVVRSHAAMALGEFHIARKDVEHALSIASNDLDHHVRDAASHALTRMGNSSMSF